MANQRYLLPANSAVPPQTPIFIKLIDNGDGTYNIGAGPSTGEALASAARAATTTSGDFPATGGNVLNFAVAATTITLAFSIVPSVQQKDPATGQYRTIMTGTTMTGTGVTWFSVGPQLTASAANFGKDIVPPVFRVIVTHTGTNLVTYGVGYSVS